MKKKLTLIALAAITFTAVQAKVLSPEAAWQRAKAPEKGAPALAPPVSNPVLARTLEKDGNATVYIFNTNNGEGFCVVSADDIAIPVLGYSDNGGFDPVNIPPGLIGWLNEYSRIISYARENGLTVSGAPAVPSLKSVGPLVTTKWNQDAPYNDQCPNLNGNKTVTGCVATAMAQVLKTYRYPARGTGSRTYKWRNNNNQDLSLDFSKISFDWANMTDTYNEKSTPAQKNAVSTLMKACGYAAQMNYGAGASGAQSFDAAAGLVQNLGFDPALRYELRIYYTITDWMKMIHDELALGHPVYYSGNDDYIGHAFVLDGYDASTGFVHINWGWGGVSDGYYQITSLNPDLQGIGGSSSNGGYEYGQTCLLGLQKPVSGHNYLPKMFLRCSVQTLSSVCTRKQNVNFLGGEKDEGACSYALVTKNYTMGVKLVASDGKVSYIWENTTNELAPLEKVTSISLPASKFPKTGVYTVTIACKSDNIISDVPAPVQYTNKLKLTCSSSQLRFEQIKNTGLIASAPEAVSKIYPETICRFKTTLATTGDDYYGEVSIIVSPKNSDEKSGYAMYSPLIDVATGQTVEVEIVGSLSSYSGFTPGDYRIAVYNNAGVRISDFTNITIINKPTETPVVKVSDISSSEFSGGNGTTENPYRIESDYIIVKGTISCSQGLYDKKPYLYFLNPDDDKLALGFSSFCYPVSEGETSPVTASYSLSTLKGGKLYSLCFYSNNLGFISDKYYVRIEGDSSGVEDIRNGENSCEISPNPVEGVMVIRASAAIGSASIYSLSGMLVKEEKFSGTSENENVEVSDLAGGHYIVRIIMGNGRTVMRRMMKR